MYFPGADCGGGMVLGMVLGLSQRRVSVSHLIIAEAACLWSHHLLQRLLDSAGGSPSQHRRGYVVLEPAAVNSFSI